MIILQDNLRQFEDNKEHSSMEYQDRLHLEGRCRLKRKHYEKHRLHFFNSHERNEYIK